MNKMGRQQGGAVVSAIVLMLLAGFLISWVIVQQPAPSGEVKAAIAASKGSPSSYSALQAFLRKHPRPTYEDMTRFRRHRDAMETQAAVAQVVQNQKRITGIPCAGISDETEKPTTWVEKGVLMALFLLVVALMVRSYVVIRDKS